MIDPAKTQKALAALEKRHLTIGAAESLTGGLFSASLCAIPGASKVFLGAFVTYGAKTKTDLLGVSAEDIARYGVVSQTVANEMAVGALTRLGADVAVSFTGNAGPTSEPGSAPVGRVYMAIATKKGHVEIAQDFLLGRNEIREACVDMMLDQLLAIFA
jgi:PncC family amidohydrolase